MVLLAAVVLAMFGITGRLAYWQFARGAELADMGLDVRSRSVPIRAPRGDILDRNGRPLSLTVTVERVFAVPLEVQDKAGTAALLARVLNLDTQEQAAVLEKLQKRSSFEYIKRRDVTEAQVLEIRNLKKQGLLAGIGLEPAAKRYYPENTLAAHVLGFAGDDNQGLSGIEAYYDKKLTGKAGAIEIEFDGRGHEIAGGLKRIVPPQPGLTMVTTLDKAIQLIVERDLERAVEETKARRAAIIVMDVRSGEILAMGSSPAFDPNRFLESDPASWRVWLVADAVSPGSSFKPLTAAAALEDGVVNLTTPFVDNGNLRVGAETINNWNFTGFGQGTIKDVLETSSNVGFATIGLQLGVERFYKYLDLFNLTRRTGIDLPGEAVGLRPPKNLAKQIDLAVMAFGQTLTVTPVQMIATINAIANDGRWVQPHLLKEFRTPEGQKVEEFKVQPRPVISPETARDLHTLLASVVENGTGSGALVAGYKVGGKTGTAEKFADGRKVEGKYVASFVGFAPVPNPLVSVLVMIDEPQGLVYGGQIAAPVFSHIMGDILRYLQVAPRVPATAGKRPAPAPQQARVPSLVNLPLEQARELIRSAGLETMVEGSGTVVTGQFPPAGATVTSGTKVRLEMKPPAAGKGTEELHVPDLTGLTLRQAGEILAKIGLYLDFEGSGAARRQEPKPGVAVTPGSRIRIWLSDRP